MRIKVDDKLNNKENSLLTVIILSVQQISPNKF